MRRSWKSSLAAHWMCARESGSGGTPGPGRTRSGDEAEWVCSRAALVQSSSHRQATVKRSSSACAEGGPTCSPREPVIRFGIALPTDGPLAAPSAVTGAAQAAADLGYASLWAPAVDMLQVASRVAGCVPLALVMRNGSMDLRGVDRLRARLAGPAAALDVVHRHIGAFLFDTGDCAPARDVADGWAPLLGPTIVLDPRCDSTRPRRLIVRMAHWPSAADLDRVLAAGAEELVLGLPGAADLDQALAAFADVAERVEEANQLAR